MEQGNIVEFIDRQKILCAVVQEVRNQRLKLLTENNREVSLSLNRVFHKSRKALDLSLGRLKTIDALREIAELRKQLMQQINIRELWEVLNSEQEWIDLHTMTEFCFLDTVTSDHESAVVRAFFQNRLYFKFDQNRFFPVSEEQVNHNIAQGQEAVRKVMRIDSFAASLKAWLSSLSIPSAHFELTDDVSACLSLLKSFYLFDKDSPHADEAKCVLGKAGIDDVEMLFPLFVKAGIFDQNENIALIRQDIPQNFLPATESYAVKLHDLGVSFTSDVSHRKDLTALPIMTIDGQSTLDYDDAISFDDDGDICCVGVHIVDVGYFVKKNDPVDQEARLRASSIYMPDKKISMLPSCLAEGLCSLKAGEIRPAISIMIRLDDAANVLDYEIFPTWIRVQRQLTYYDVNMMVDTSHEIIRLCDIAARFRQKRLENGAVQITLPDINVWLGENGVITVNRINRESPGRMMVTEIMILANWLMARFLSDRETSAIFRAQPGPRERLYKGVDGTLFQNYMQRRLLSRFMLYHQAERHSGLGLGAYVTATSPIRKYYDLVTQRQIRAVLGLEVPYTTDEVRRIIQQLQEPMQRVSRMQYQRTRYWILKSLESRIGQKEEALVLGKRRNAYQVLLTEYMIECDLPMGSKMELKPETSIQVTLQYVSARRDVLSIFM